MRTRSAGRKFNLIIVALLFLAVALLVFDLVRHRKANSTTEVGAKSIAVLPFENLSEEKSNAYFADGVQDEILTDLAKIADLKVISRTSTVQYKSGVARNLREIAQQLGVTHILEGSAARERQGAGKRAIDRRAARTHMSGPTLTIAIWQMFSRFKARSRRRSRSNCMRNFR